MLTTRFVTEVSEKKASKRHGSKPKANTVEGRYHMLRPSAAFDHLA
jgi:hypothetical protein